MCPERLEILDVVFHCEFLSIGYYFGAALTALVVIDHTATFGHRFEVGAYRFEAVARPAVHRDHCFGSTPDDLVKDPHLVRRQNKSLCRLVGPHGGRRAERYKRDKEN